MCHQVQRETSLVRELQQTVSFCWTCADLTTARKQWCCKTWPVTSATSPPISHNHHKRRIMSLEVTNFAHQSHLEIKPFFVWSSPRFVKFMLLPYWPTWVICWALPSTVAKRPVCSFGAKSCCSLPSAVTTQLGLLIGLFCRIQLVLEVVLKAVTHGPELNQRDCENQTWVEVSKSNILSSFYSTRTTQLSKPVTINFL